MKTYARIQDGRVVELIVPYERQEKGRPAAPDPLSDDASPVQIAAHNAAQAAHDNFQVGPVPIEELYTPELVATLVETTNVDPKPKEGWTWDGAVFAPYVTPPPTAADILATNTAIRVRLLQAASLAIETLQDAIDLGINEPGDATMLTAWKTFRVKVSQVDLTAAAPAWPVPPQAGWGASVTPETGLA